MAVHGEMMDSSAYLAVVMMSLVHNLSMSALGALEVWVDRIEEETNFIAVTKLNFHIRECTKVCQEMDNYLRVFHTIVEDMISEDPDQAPKEITAGILRRQALTGLSADGDTLTPAMPASDSKYFELSPSTMEPFLGPIGIRTLPFLLDGSQLYEVKGTVFWCSQLEIYFNRLSKLSDLYAKKLDEKRNFWSFILTIVSIGQFPLGAMTGYWGMNTEGHDELAADWWPAVPGIQYFWFIAGVIYFVMLACLIHSRVLYAAS